MKWPLLLVLQLLGAILLSGCSSFIFGSIERTLSQSKGASVSNFVATNKLNPLEASITSLGFKNGRVLPPTDWRSVTKFDGIKIFNVFEIEILSTDQEAADFFINQGDCILGLSRKNDAMSHFRKLHFFPGSQNTARVIVRAASTLKGFNYIETSRSSAEDSGIIYIASSLPSRLDCLAAKSWLASVVDTITHEVIHIINRLNSPAKSAISDEIVAYLGGMCAAKIIDIDFISHAPFWINEENIWESKIPATFRAAYIANQILMNPFNENICSTDFSKYFLPLDEWHAVNFASSLMVAGR